MVSVVAQLFFIRSFPPTLTAKAETASDENLSNAWVQKGHLIIKIVGIE
jgi:hypothetical protein